MEFTETPKPNLLQRITKALKAPLQAPEGANSSKPTTNYSHQSTLREANRTFKNWLESEYPHNK